MVGWRSLEALGIWKEETCGAYSADTYPNPPVSFPLTEARHSRTLLLKNSSRDWYLQNMNSTPLEHPIWLLETASFPSDSFPWGKVPGFQVSQKVTFCSFHWLVSEEMDSCCYGNRKQKSMLQVQGSGRSVVLKSLFCYHESQVILQEENSRINSRVGKPQTGCYWLCIISFITIISGDSWKNLKILIYLKARPLEKHLCSKTGIREIPVEPIYFKEFIFFSK